MTTVHVGLLGSVDVFYKTIPLRIMRAFEFMALLTTTPGRLRRVTGPGQLPTTSSL